MIITTRKDVVWNYLGFLFNSGANIFLLPFVLRHLTSTELGIWYSFLGVGFLVNLLDFGFSPTITRNISYAMAGATDIVKSGFIEVAENQPPNYSLLFSLVKLSSKLYTYISAAAFVLIGSLGSIYIISITKHINDSTVLIAWAIFVIAATNNIFNNFWSPVLRGIGEIVNVNKAAVFSKSIHILISLLGLYLGFSLIAVAGAYLISSLSIGVFSRYYFKKHIKKSKINSPIGEYNVDSLFNKIWFNSWRVGLVALGTYFINQANTLICSLYLGLEETAKYGLTLQLINLIGALSVVFSSTVYPELAASKVKGDEIRSKKLVGQSYGLLWLTYVSLSFLLIFFGNFALQIIGANSSLLEGYSLVFLIVILFLEFNHSLSATIITISNEVPFWIPSLISGFCIVILSLFLVKIFKLSLFGLLLSQFIVQFLYNNWKWPYVVKQNYSLSLRDVFSSTKLFLLGFGKK